MCGLSLRLEVRQRWREPGIAALHLNQEPRRAVAHHQEVHFAFRLRDRTLLTPGEYGGWNVYDVPGLKGRQCGKQRRHEWAQIRDVIAWCAQRDHAETSVPNSLLKLYGPIDGDEGVEPGLIDKR